MRAAGSSSRSWTLEGVVTEVSLNLYYIATVSIYLIHQLSIYKIIHSLVFKLRGRVGRNQNPFMWPVWLWHTAFWASSWG